MSDLRKTAQQALEALYEETAWFGPTPKGAAAITALRAALVEPEPEPVAWALHTGTRQGIKWNRRVEHGTPLYTAFRAALAEPTVKESLQVELAPEPGDFDHGIGADRFKVVRGAFWWHVLIGDSTTEHGKFRSRASAEKMAADLLREFRNGAFVQYESGPTQTTHSEGCYKWHHECAIARIEELKLLCEEMLSELYVYRASKHLKDAAAAIRARGEK